MIRPPQPTALPDVPVSIRLIQRANRTLGSIAPATIARLNQRLFVRPRRFSARAWEHAFESTATRTRLPSGNSILHVGDGPAVACLHGWEGRGTQFASFAPALLAAGFSVVAIDGPAHGHSRGETADPFLFADALREVSELRGPLQGVIAHSMGAGGAAIALSLGLEVPRVVFIASPASLHEVLHRFASAMHLPAVATGHFVAEMRRRVGSRATGKTDLEELSRSITTAALIIHSRDDREVPFSDGARIAAALPQAQLLALDGLGHRRIMRDPAVIAAAVDFIGA